jgi:DNA-binding GntR family transcriptional regulator
MDFLAGSLLHAESLTEKAYRALEEDIVTLRIPPGTVVSEAILSRRLGLGRTPVREALQRLAREWLVVVLPRRGVVVSDVDPVKQLRLLETRMEIERFLARTAARNATAGQRAQLAAIADGMEQAGRESGDLAFMRLDHEFNALVLDAANNEFAASAMSQMNGLARRFWFMHRLTAADLPKTARLHANVARAIAEGDAGGAACASGALVGYIQDVTRSVIG